MGLTDFTRTRAFFTHLSMSAGIFLVISYLIIFHWYPDFYFFLDGGVRAITTIFFVDVVLGPGLTLLVFKPGKKSLKFDMAVILLLQLSALSWGVQSVYKEQSGLAVFYLGKLACVSHSENAGYDLATIAAGLSGKQHLAILQRPDTIEDYFVFSKQAFLNGAGEIYYYKKNVMPLDADTLGHLDRFTLDMALLKTDNAEDAKIVETYISNHPGNDESYKLLPLVCRYGKALAVYDKQTLKITDTLDIETKPVMKDLDFPSTGGKTVHVIEQ